MKKILFATTALIATASVAAADVRFSGYGRFGLDYNDANARTGLNGQNNAANGVSSTTITSRLRLQVDMSTESDGGVAFGARFRAQAESRDNTAGGATFNGARFYASYGGFTVQVGNITGAIEGMSGLYLPTSSADTGIDGMGFHSIVGNTVGGNSFAWDAYSSAGVGSNGVELIYSSGAFGAHLSYSTRNGAVAVDRVAANASYTFGDWTAAIGIQDSDIVGEDKVIVTVKGDIGQFGVGLAYAQNSDAGGVNVDIDKLRIYGKMDVGSAGTVLLWVTSQDGPNAVIEGTSFGLNYSHDLGGGVSFDAGAVRNITANGQDQSQVQAGVYFRF